MSNDADTQNKIVSNEMICSIASTTAMGTDGVEKMFMRLSDELLDAIYPSAVAQGVKVTEYDAGYTIDLHVITRIHSDIPKVGREVQIKVKEAVEVMTGKVVSQVNLHIKGSGKY